MRQNPVHYGGVAAVIVFAIGLLAVGQTRAGLGILALGVLAMAIVLAPTASGKALFVAIGALIFGGFMGYHALSNELTGTAIYHAPRGVSSKLENSEPVTRADSPAKFHEATNLLWAGSFVGLFAGVVAFKFSRKLDASVDDF